MEICHSTPLYWVRDWCSSKESYRAKSGESLAVCTQRFLGKVKNKTKKAHVEFLGEQSDPSVSRCHRQSKRHMHRLPQQPVTAGAITNQRDLCVAFHSKWLQETNNTKNKLQDTWCGFLFPLVTKGHSFLAGSLGFYLISWFQLGN